MTLGIQELSLDDITSVVLSSFWNNYIATTLNLTVMNLLSKTSKPYTNTVYVSRCSTKFILESFMTESWLMNNLYFTNNREIDHNILVTDITEKLLKDAQHNLLDIWSILRQQNCWLINQDLGNESKYFHF